MWGQILTALLVFLYPPHCLLCKRALLQQGGLCKTCAQDAGCTADEQGLAVWLDGIEIYVLKEFNDAMRQLVHMLKYRGKRLPGQLLGRALGHCLLGHLKIDQQWVVIPIPLHSARLRERGYNQSTIIAKAVANALGLVVADKVLKRTRYTLSQTRFDRGDRLENVAGAFCVQDAQGLRGREIILVDDVVTTGATARACVETLQKAGARRVVIAAVARPKLGDDRLQD